MTTQMTRSRQSLRGRSDLAVLAQSPDRFAAPFHWQVNPLAELAEQTGVRDWAMRRLDKAALPASSLRGFGEQTGVTQWGGRRIDKSAIPASDFRGMSGLSGSDYRYTGLGRFPVNPLASADYRVTGLNAVNNRRWPVNEFGETVDVNDWQMRRLDKTALPASSLRGVEDRLMGLDGFGSFGAGDELDGNIQVRDFQVALRKVGYCDVGGQIVYADGIWGPITAAAALAMAGGNAGLFSGSDGSREMRISLNWWSKVQAETAGKIDACRTASGGAGRGGSSNVVVPSDSDDSDPSPGPGPRDSVQAGMSPWLWGAIALAAVGVGYYMLSEPADDTEASLTWRLPRGGR